MKPNLLTRLILAALLAGAPALSAQDTATDERLARALERYPDADADKDGKLSMAEALAYLEAHPDLKAKFGGKPRGSGAPSSVGPSSTAASNLPAGPRVFVCAHSYMIFTAAMLAPLAESAGFAHRDAGKQMLGGSRVLQHWNLPDDQNWAKDALREGKVDVLTLSPNLQLPDEGIDNFTKLGLEKNPKLRVLVQASWVPFDGRHDGDRRSFRNAMRDEVTAEEVRQQRDRHHGSWLKRIEAQVRALNAAVGREAVFIVPVSAAVYALRERIAEGKAPGLAKQSEMFRDDHGHPATPMALLATYCHFAAIYQRSPVGLPVPALLKNTPHAEELNRLLQQLAWDAVSNYPMSGVKAGDETKAP